MDLNLHHGKASVPASSLFASPPILAPIPTVRTDVVRSLLSSHFSISSNVPLELVLTPAERNTVHEMAEGHLAYRDVTWLHIVVEEPQLNLKYRKQLYVAAPITNYDWRGAVGLPKSVTTSHWLPVAFYKADLDHRHNNHFRMAGIEVVRDADEAHKVLNSWNSPDSLQSIGNILGMTLLHAPAPL